MKHGRLIDADALIEDVRKNSASYFADDFAHEWVDRQPTIEERKTAKDICDTAYGHCEFKCSVCGVEIGVVEGGELDGGYFKFCPNCGTRMENK